MLLPSGEEGCSPNENTGFPDTSNTTCNRSNKNAGFLDTTNYMVKKAAQPMRMQDFHTQQKPHVKVCSHLTFAFASTSPSKFNIASMETQTQTHRMGLNPFLTFYIGVDANANVKCEHTFTEARHNAEEALLVIHY